MNAKFLRLLCLTAVSVALTTLGFSQPNGNATGQTHLNDSWGISPRPTTKPSDYVAGDPGKVKKPKRAKSGSGGAVAAFAVNPDPGGTGIVYSDTADNPDADVAVRNLAENLGNDPIRMYEWVRNNVRTEFYFGAHRGAYLTMLERAGNDIDQCALLGALFKAAGYTPTYRLERIDLPRTATGANQVGAYEWLGVDNDTSALNVISGYLPSVTSGGLINFEQMWVTINIPGRGDTRFAPAIKPHSIGRQPDLDALSGYTWNDVAVASGSGSRENYSNAISQANVRNYFTGRATVASDAIRNSSTLHDLSGAELARLPVIVPELVTTTAPGATSYPASPVYPSGATALTGIPETYCGWFRVKVGTVESWFEATELLGRTLAVEFDGNGHGIIRHNGAEITRDTSGTSAGTVAIEITFEPASAYYGGTAPQYKRSETVSRQNSVAVVYSSGRCVDRLQKLLQDVAEREAANPANVTLTDRLQIMGQQYASQTNELTALGTAYLGHDTRWHYLAGMVYVKDGRPVISMGIALVGLHSRSAFAPTTKSVTSAAVLLMGALEGTAIEQHSGARAFGAPSLFDHAMTLGYGARYITSVGELNSAGLVNFNSPYIDPAAVQAYLNAGRHVVVLSYSNVTYNGLSFGGYFTVDPATGYVGSLIGNAKGGQGSAGSGNASVAGQQKPKETETQPTHEPAKSTDPVDLTNGAFLKDDTDLVVGNEGDPNGLALTRNYNSARRLSDPAGLGRGFTHGYAMRLQLRSPNDLDALRAGVDEVLPVLLALRHAQDTLNFEPQAARSWLMSSTALTWAVNEQINSRASLVLGARSMEFVRRPNGSYTAPSHVAATLAKQGDNSHTLAFRHGNTLAFRASDGRFTSITDPHGNVLSASYDGSNRLDLVTDSYGRTLDFSYDGAGRLTGVADSTGRSVSYGRTPEGHFTFTDPEGKQQRLEMDADYLLTKVVDARGRTVVENDYDAWKRVWRQRTFGDAARTSHLHIAPGYGAEKDPAGHTMRTYFDARGRKIFTVDQEGHRSTWRYDGVDRLVQAITPLGLATSFGYNPAHVLTSVTNPAGHTRTIDPDAQHRPWKVRNFEGQETVFTYTAQHKVESVTAPGGLVSTFEYDTRGRLWKHHPAHYAAGQVDTTTYDSFGNIDKVTHPADGHTSDPDFDDYASTARGDLTEMIDRRGVRTTYDYNLRRQPTSTTLWEGATGRTSQVFYDDAGDVDYTLDASSRKVDSEHDALGHLTQVKRGPAASQIVALTQAYDSRNLLQTSTDALGHNTTFAYTNRQLPLAVKDHFNRATTYAHDADGRRVSVTTTLGHVSTTVYTAQGFTDAVQDAENQLADFGYDKDGRRTGLANRLNKNFGWTYNDATRTVTSTTPTGKTTTAVNDARGLPASVAEPSGQTTTFNTYDNEGRLTSKTDGVATTTYNYWPNGLLKDVTEGAKTTTRTYDALNRLASYADGEGNTIGYQYHPSGELWKITYPGNKIVTYTYDDFGRLHQVVDWDNRTTTYGYDNASRLTTITRPNGTVRELFYTDDNRLQRVKERTFSGAVIFAEHLFTDADGRIEGLFRRPSAPSILPPEDAMTHDFDNRIATWTAAGGSAQTVVHDADGNMTTGPLPNGNMGTYGYNSRNWLTSANGSSYTYNPDGLRTAITGTGAATFVVDPNAALSRTLMRVKGGVTTYYVYGLGLLYEETGGNTKTYHYDKLGSTIALTDSLQAVSDRWDYAPFGATAQRTGTTDTPFQWHGELGVQTDANGLHHMRARYYNCRVMRFCNADPIGFDGGLNWYASFNNNPVSNVDPTGEVVPLVGAGIGAAIGGIVGGVAGYVSSGGDWNAAAAGAAGGVVSGALVGSGAGLVAWAASYGATAAIGTSAALGAAGGAAGNLTSQTVGGLVRGQDLQTAASNVSGKQVATAAAVGGLTGSVAGLAGVARNAINAEALVRNATAANSLNTISAELMKQGASLAKIHEVQDAIVRGMQVAGGATLQKIAIAKALEAAGLPAAEETVNAILNAGTQSKPGKK